ncbi:hypothetical protein [Agrobacterium vitis]|uniref:hypothetical protein n=1 Tax=Agrobacterium vitis TaxID=373 RepID=UPI0015735948|nr:hypothetical protein [Agrobacterium vitis]NSZ52946.1 hypothetical protein [Agrobacterium vitis]NTA31705.1 hypothetical protein [Agrobacterium vitis]
MTDFPKDGSTFVVECIDRTAYRWAKYKPQGAKQMGKPGRWQKMVVNGDWHRWENCEDPIGQMSALTEDGPISKAFKQYGALAEELFAALLQCQEYLRYSFGSGSDINPYPAMDAAIERAQKEFSNERC